MQYRLGIAAICAVVLVVLLQGGASGSSKAQAEFNETEIRHTLGKESETWRARVYTRQGKFAGNGVIACVPTSTADSLQECTGIYILPRGRVAVQGGITSRAGFNLLIIGGSDAYSGAQGSLVVTQTQKNPRHSRLTFFFE